MECFCLRRTFPFVRFAIVLGRGPNLTSSGHRIPFCLLQWRLRPLGNTSRLMFPADSTLKWSLLARCRDRCYSPLIYTCPHLFVLRIPLTDWLTNTEGSGVSFVSGGLGWNVPVVQEFISMSSSICRTLQEKYLLPLCWVCIKEQGKTIVYLIDTPYRTFPSWNSPYPLQKAGLCFFLRNWRCKVSVPRAGVLSSI